MVNGQPVDEAQQAMKLISKQRPDTFVRLDGSRQGKPFATQAKIGQRPAVTSGE